MKMKSLKPLQVFFILSVIGFLLYARTLLFDYTNFDDNVLLIDNKEFIRNLSNFSEAFRKTVFISGHDVFYRPIETIWFMINAQFTGNDWKQMPPVFHVSAIMLHVVAVFLIFILLKRLNRTTETSFILSLLFLVHPVLTMSVAWVPGVVDILLTVFSLSGFIFFMNFIESNNRRDYVLHLLFFLLALYTKETAIVLPIICVLYHALLFLKKITFREMWRSQKIFYAGWAFISAIWFMMRSHVLKNTNEENITEMIRSVFENLPGMIQYIGKIFFPVNLSVMPVMKDTTFWYGTIAILFMILLYFFSKEKNKKMMVFALIWFSGFLLPTFIKTSEFRVHQFYEHRLYLPLFGILIYVSETDWLKKFSFRNKIMRIQFLILITVLFVLSFRHLQVFRDTKSFLDNAVSTSPHSSLAHRNLGIYYQDMAAHDTSLLRKAAEEYRKALKLNPREKDLHNNLGTIYDTWNMKTLAEKEYLKEIELNPKQSQAYHNLGMLYSEQNEYAKAENFLKKAIEINPSKASLEQLALVYHKTGNKKELENIMNILYQKEAGKNSHHKQKTSQPPMTPQQAEQELLKKLEKDSSDKFTLHNLGLLYYQTGRRPEAEKYWRKAVEADSTYVEALNNLAIVLALQGKKEQAEMYMKKVIRNNPNYIEGYFNLANFYAKNGNEKEALRYVYELKKRGISKKHFKNISPEVEKLFDK